MGSSSSVAVWAVRVFWVICITKLEGKHGKSSQTLTSRQSGRFNYRRVGEARREFGEFALFAGYATQMPDVKIGRE
jgi:hypothetical protein